MAPGHVLNEKVPKGSAIKNSAIQDPEGYWPMLESPMCNGALALGPRIFLSILAITSACSAWYVLFHPDYHAMDLTDDDIAFLKICSSGAKIDYAVWPALVSRLIYRLEKVIPNEFPVPSVPRSPSSATSSPTTLHSQKTPPTPSADSSSQSVADLAQSADKENVTPTPTPHATTSDPNPSNAPGSLHPQLDSLLSSIISTLNTHFTVYPPHTIQRLSELILQPKLHYRSLPAYLHAFDRVVHVTSGAHLYPLPAPVPDANGAKILTNGVSSGPDPESISWGNSTQVPPNLGSDESLGGALLTPIPWLQSMSATNGEASSSDLEGEVKTERTETIDGPNGAGSIETVSVSVNGVSSTTLASVGDSSEGGLRAEGGVTQGELLRQEQRAGVVPATQLAHMQQHPNGDGEEEEAPHARGPEEIGMEDMGPQGPGNNIRHGIQGIDVEAAVGRKVEAFEGDESEEKPSTPKREADEEIQSDSKRVKDGNDGDEEMTGATDTGNDEK
ncbi:hypothetical protein V495_03894 [Pseudogymnoascus sp. VKM F-4514 (FW-929)]|nr:hypothetical protein V495_03894 [Pseudogymnoascus sp. VKM F-4514 (FW-929)]KFY60384.1 hypothetical protein V497_03673 [Pseudogymnoascus sp. VKM F-4516 (FW-969)]